MTAGQACNKGGFLKRSGDLSLQFLDVHECCFMESGLRLRTLGKILATLITIATAMVWSAQADSKIIWPDDAELDLLKRGEAPVIVSRLEEQGNTYIRGVVYIPESPSEIWKVMSSCPEVVEMVPQIRQCEIRERKGSEATIYHKVKISSFFPSLDYVLDANFEESRGIHIRLKEGDLKEFDAQWEIDSRSTDVESWVVIRIYMNPGTLIPQGLVNGKLEKHIPKVMTAFRDRVLAQSTLANSGGGTHSI